MSPAAIINTSSSTPYNLYGVTTRSGGVPNRHLGEPTAELPSLRSPPQVGLQTSGVLQGDASTFGFRGGLHPQGSSHLRQRPFESECAMT